MASLVGSRVERKEDKKLLTGRGKYTADVTFAHQTYAYFVRSPHARAQIKNVDTSKAEKASGKHISSLELKLLLLIQRMN